MPRSPQAVSRAILVTLSVLFCTVVGLRQFSNPGQLIASDGIGYFVHLPSILMEGNIDYRNEMAHLGLSMPRNQWAIGTAIAWLPFYLLGHLISVSGAFFGLSWPTNGMGFPEQLMCCWATIVYGSAAVALSYRFACRWFDPRWSLWGTALFFGASNLPYYMLAEPYMSHGVSAFFSSLLLYLGVREKPLSLGQWALVGTVAGLAALTRVQDGLFLVAPLLWQAFRFRDLKPLLTATLVTGLLSASLFSVQAVIWKHGLELEKRARVTENHQPTHRAKRPGRPSRIVKGGRLAWTSPKFRNQFFGLQWGLFVWHPIYLLATLGLLLTMLKKPRLGGTLLCAVLLQSYLISAWDGMGQTFGGRLFLGSFAYFNLGFVGLLAAARPGQRKVLGGLGALLVGECVYLMIRYRMLVSEGRTLPGIFKVLGLD